MVMLGGSGDRTKGGRNLDYFKNTNRLLQSMMDKMNVTQKPLPPRPRHWMKFSSVGFRLRSSTGTLSLGA